MTRPDGWIVLGVILLLTACGTGTGEPGPESGPMPRPHAPPPDTTPGDLSDAVATGMRDAAWHLYRPDGSPATLDDLLEAAAGVDVVLVGERHGDPGGHRFQRELLDAVLQEAGTAPGAKALDGRRPVLSMEMFESDVQPVLDEYLDGLITEEHFLAAARPWPFYQRDYRPLVERAREARIPVVAANAPRRYVNRVSRLGRTALDDLAGEALEHLPPLPYPGPSEAYRMEWEAIMSGIGHDHGGHGQVGQDDPALEAQALWDAAMAHSVVSALEDGGQVALVVHMAGSFHVENGTGIPEALRHYRPDVRDLLVVVKAVEDPAAPPARDEVAGVGDFIVLTRADPPR